MDTVSITAGSEPVQVFIAALVLIAFAAFSGGWVRWLQQRLEVFSLSGKLPIAYQANLEKLAELLELDSAMQAFSQGMLWSLIATVEAQLKPLRRMAQG
jgi:hypothetical protein